jgi:hypothetical protein
MDKLIRIGLFDPADELPVDESDVPLRDFRAPALDLREGLDEAVRPQREISMVVGEEVQIVREAVLEVTARSK